MKITDPDVIKNGEKDLIESLGEDLDPEAVVQIIRDKITDTKLSSKGGQIVVHNNEIAFKIDFDLHLSASLMFDRQGNLIPDSTENQKSETQEKESDPFDIDLSSPDDTEDSDFIEEDDDILADDSESIVDDDINDNLLDPEKDEGSEPEEELEDTLEENELEDDLIDDDINDILKESREFWDQKKE